MNKPSVKDLARITEMLVFLDTLDIWEEEGEIDRASYNLASIAAHLSIEVLKFYEEKDGIYQDTEDVDPPGEE